MGRIASNMSDIVIVTSDNPRTEDRESIIEDIMQGIKMNNNIYIEQDRVDAIKLGHKLARPGDIVLIAGKGSENYIDENNKKVPYSDLIEVQKIGV